MLSISQPLIDPEYLLRTARLNYYTEGGEPVGRWHGGGQEVLGVSGEVKPDDLRHLFRGVSVDGRTKLVQDPPKKRKRQCAWDLTFSADKSISTAWAVGDERVRAAIEAAQLAAVLKALDFLEREAGLTRRGKGSTRIEKAQLIFAVFQHGSSRAQDPQLHHHCMLLNLSVRDDLSTGSIVSKSVFRLKMIAGLVYRQELGHQLRKNLGFELRAQKTWLEIAGIPSAVIDMFSKRRKEVLEYLERMGKSDAISAAAATMATRSGKELKPRAELFAEWSRQAREEHGFSHESIARLIQPYRPCRQPIGLHAAIDSLLTQQSYFSDRQFLRRVLERNQATGHPVDRILKGVALALRNLVDLGLHDGHRLYTTRDVVRQEQLLIEKAMEGRQSTRHVLSERAAQKAGKDLAPAQQGALRHLVVEPGDLKLLQGLAGTGKSSLLKAAYEGWTKAGFRVVGAAYSGKAAEGLAESSGIPSQTVDRLLYQWAKELSAVRPLDRKTILVVDEAGMLDTLKLARLLAHVKAAGAKLVLVGDEKQLPPISAGAPFAELGRRLGRSELTQIHRQKNELLRMVVEELASGSVRRALNLLKHDKLLGLHDTVESAREALVADWFKFGVSRNSLMLAGTREDVRDLNRRAQELRLEAGQLGLSMFKLNGTNFRLGERVVFGKNDRLLGVLNGSVGELTAYNPFKEIATFKLDTGKSVFIPIRRYTDIGLGYCITTHRAQGTTVDRSFILWSDGMQSRELTYVEASRARLLTRFYLTKEQAGTDFADALKDMERTVAKDLAVTKAREAKRDLSREPGMSHSI